MILMCRWMLRAGCPSLCISLPPTLRSRFPFTHTPNQLNWTRDVPRQLFCMQLAIMILRHYAGNGDISVRPAAVFSSQLRLEGSTLALLYRKTLASLYTHTLLFSNRDVLFLLSLVLGQLQNQASVRTLLFQDLQSVDRLVAGLVSRIDLENQDMAALMLRSGQAHSASLHLNASRFFLQILFVKLL